MIANWFERLPLSRWALLGTLMLLCGAWVMPSNKLYHQCLIFLLWLPAFLALWRPDCRRHLLQPELVLFCLFSVWTLLVLFVQGAGGDSSNAKLPFYVVLSLLGIVLAACDERWPLERVLRVAVWVGGVFALISVIYFLWLFPLPRRSRLIALGLWDTPIMAAHAIGALAVLGAFLERRRLPVWGALLGLVPVLGYLLFLGVSQTRGVWIALFVSLTLMAALLPSRRVRLFVALAVVVVVLVASIAPEYLLQRGFSYRPVLFMGGLELFKEHVLLGLGFADYEIFVPGNGNYYKHPHNMYLDVAIRLGLPGLLLFAALWLSVAWRAWENRKQRLGQALLALWFFASVSLLTDGIGLWFKPNADWFVTWLPIALSLVLAYRGASAKA